MALPMHVTCLRGVFMVVKGVSDHADKDKADNWQPQAAMNAVAALYKAMKSYPKILGKVATEC